MNFASASHIISANSTDVKTSRINMYTGGLNKLEMLSAFWETFGNNVSLWYNSAISYNQTKFYNLDKHNLLEVDPINMGIFTGFLLAWLNEFQIFSTKISSSIDHCMASSVKTIFSILLNTICLILIASFVASILTIFFIYRKIIEIILKISLGNEFKGLLEGTDVIWAIADPSALSVINIFAVLELSADTTGANILEDFRNLVKSRLLSANFAQLHWLREKKYGYYYWRKADNVDLEERIRWLDDEHNECEGSCNSIYGGYLRSIMTKVSNQPLPRDHTTCWEILIQRNCQYSPEINAKNLSLLFRVHHTLGDGVALLRLLLEAIANKKSSFCHEESREYQNNQKQNIQERIPILMQNNSMFCNNGIYENPQVIYYSMDSLGASMPFTKINTLPSYKIENIQIQLNRMIEMMIFITTKLMSKMKKRFREFSRVLMALVMAPSCFIQQTLRSMDESVIHGSTLTGDKIISCWMEDDFKDSRQCSLLAKIRKIKNLTGTRFGDMVLAALSVNLHKYFLQITEIAPERVSVVLPARMSASIISEKLTLNNNRFSVALLPLCISQVNGVHHEYPSDDLSADYLVNYWIMTHLAAALPVVLLKPFIQSHSSMVFSNLIGPSAVSIQGHTLKKTAVWIPHKETTGIGCSCLSYNGNIHLTLIVDKAVITSEKHVDEILRGTVCTIDYFYDNIISLVLQSNPE